MYVSVEGGFSTNCFECCVNGGMRASFKRSFGLWYLRRFIGLGLMFDIGDADSIKWQVRNVGETTRDFKLEESKNEMNDRMARAALLFFPSTLPPRVKHLVPLSDPPHDTVIRVIMYQ